MSVQSLSKPDKVGCVRFGLASYVDIGPDALGMPEAARDLSALAASALPWRPGMAEGRQDCPGGPQRPLRALRPGGPGLSLGPQVCCLALGYEASA